MATENIEDYGPVRWLYRDGTWVLQQRVSGYRWSDDDVTQGHFEEWRDVPRVEDDG